MKYLKLGKSNLTVPQIAQGFMRITNLDDKTAEGFIQKCLELGINFFDHADIYGNGECERKFSKVFPLTSENREKIILQSKCGIVPGVMYDLSKDYILNSVDGILSRLGTDYLDILVLHRPDALVEPEEVAEAFDILSSNGKVKYFGVSNHKPSQIEILKKYLHQDIIVNQMQFSIPVSNMVANGMEVNMLTDGAVNRDESVLDYCRLNDVTIQAWSPFQSPNGVFIDNGNYPDLNHHLWELGKKYNVSKETIAAAWILRHPAKIQLVSGTMNQWRIEQIAKATEIELTREEWYRLYISAGHILP